MAGSVVEDGSMVVGPISTKVTGECLLELKGSKAELGLGIRITEETGLVASLKWLKMM